MRQKEEFKSVALGLRCCNSFSQIAHRVRHMTQNSGFTAGRYAAMYNDSQCYPEAFWREAARAIDWFENPTITFDPNDGVYGRWFPDGICKTCYNMVDCHVQAGRGKQAAFIYDSPVTGTKRTIS